MLDEIWLPVVDFPGYSVSSYGRVRHDVRGVLKASTRTRIPYRYVNLRDKGQAKAQYVHRLVAQAFIPNPESLPLVLHGPQGCAVNTLDNLRWGTNSDNMRDRIRDGTDPNLRKTHCPRGHEYLEGNTIWSNSVRPKRKCRTCHNERRRKNR